MAFNPNAFNNAAFLVAGAVASIASSQVAVATQSVSLVAIGNISSTQTAVATQTASISGVTALSSAQAATATQSAALIAAIPLQSIQTATATQSAALYSPTALTSSHVAVVTQTAHLFADFGTTVTPVTVTAKPRQLTVIRKMQNITAKTPTEIVPLVFDFTALASAVDSVVSLTVINERNTLDTSLTVSGQVINGSTVSCNLSGGQLHSSYVIACLIQAGSNRYQMAARTHVQDYV